MRISKEVCLEHSIARGGIDTLKGWNVTNKKIFKFFAEKFGVTVKIDGKTYAVKKKEAVKFLQQSSEYKDKKLTNSTIIKQSLQDFRNSRVAKMLFSQLENGKPDVTMLRSDFRDAMKVVLHADNVDSLMKEVEIVSSPSSDSLSISKDYLSRIVRGEPLFPHQKSTGGIVRVMDEKGIIQDVKYNYINESESGKRFASWTEKFRSSQLSDR